MHSCESLSLWPPLTCCWKREPPTPQSLLTAFLPLFSVHRPHLSFTLALCTLVSLVSLWPPLTSYPAGWERERESNPLHTHSLLTAAVHLATTLNAAHGCTCFLSLSSPQKQQFALAERATELLLSIGGAVVVDYSGLTNECLIGSWQSFSPFWFCHASP